MEFTNGESATYTALPPEWMKWEQKTGNTIQQVSEKLGIADLMFLAYHAMKREAAGKPVKPFEMAKLIAPPDFSGFMWKDIQEEYVRKAASLWDNV